MLVHVLLVGCFLPLYCQMLLCRYRHVFGQERTGFHEHRTLGMATYDVLGTVLIAYGISAASYCTFPKALLKLGVASVICHWLFCVDSVVLSWLKKLS